MTSLSDILTHCSDLDPSADLVSQLAAIPAKGVVYLMCDADDRPVQLLCVKNLRASLHRRLSEAPAEVARRVNLRELVRKVHWRRVDSAFEADWIYYQAARLLFPDTYPELVSFRPAWFIHVDPNAEFPKYTRTTDLAPRDGIFIGPMRDKADASALIELLQDAFDLCRYHSLLLQSPNAKPCAYKDMGKCPAPCDGSISMPQYRRLVHWSAHFALDPSEHLRQQQGRMTAAATELRFELAGRIKQYIDQLSGIGKSRWRDIAGLSDLSFVTVQPGPKPNTAKVYLVGPNRIEQIAGLIGPLDRPAEILRTLFDSIENMPAHDRDGLATDRMALLARHLFQSDSGTEFLPLKNINETQLVKVFANLKKQKAIADATNLEAEDLQAIDDEGLSRQTPCT